MKLFCLRSNKVFKPVKFPVIIREEQAAKSRLNSFCEGCQAKVLGLIAFHKIGFSKIIFIVQKYASRRVIVKRAFAEFKKQ